MKTVVSMTRSPPNELCGGSSSGRGSRLPRRPDARADHGDNVRGPDQRRGECRGMAIEHIAGDREECRAVRGHGDTPACGSEAHANGAVPEQLTLSVEGSELAERQVGETCEIDAGPHDVEGLRGGLRLQLEALRPSTASNARGPDELLRVTDRSASGQPCGATGAPLIVTSSAAPVTISG